MSEEKARQVCRDFGMTPKETDEFIEGVKKGLKAAKAGKVRPWNLVKRELGIK